MSFATFLSLKNLQFPIIPIILINFKYGFGTSFGVKKKSNVTKYYNIIVRQYSGNFRAHKLTFKAAPKKMSGQGLSTKVMPLRHISIDSTKTGCKGSGLPFPLGRY